MPKQNASTLAIQTSKVVDVLKKVQEGATIKDACADAGISDDMYRDWMLNNADSIQYIQGMIATCDRLSLTEIVAARRKLITSIITDAVLTNDPYLRIQAESRLAVLQKDLEKRAIPEAKEETLADDFLQGIHLTKTSVTVKTKEDGSVQVDIEPSQSRIIDA